MPRRFDPANVPLLDPLVKMLALRHLRPVLGHLSLNVHRGRIVDAHVQLERCPRTEREAADAFARLRWPYGWRCNRCRHADFTVSESRPRQRRCVACGLRQSVTSGTALHGKHDLCRWFAAAMVLGSARQGSAHNFSRLWKCNAKTAWATFHLLRKLASEACAMPPHKEKPSVAVTAWSKCRPDAHTRVPRRRNVGMMSGLWSKWTHYGFVAEYPSGVHTDVRENRPLKAGKLQLWSHPTAAGAVSWQSELVTSLIHLSVSPRWVQRYRGCLAYRANVARHGRCARVELLRLVARAPPLRQREVPPP